MKTARALGMFLVLVGFLFFAMPIFAAGPPVVINEVMYNPTGSEVAGEWVELYVDASPGDMAGWTLQDAAGNTYTFPALTPAAGEYIVLHTGSGTDDLTPPVYELYWGRGSGVWNNTGDEILLSNTTVGVDYIAFGSATPTIAGSLTWLGTNPTAGEGYTISLKNNGVDTDTGDDWEQAGTTVTRGPSSMGMDNTAPAEVWVDDDFSVGNSGGHIWGVDAFAVIQDGIVAVGGNGTVNIANGIYTETLSISTKSIAFLGESEAGVTVDTSLATTGYGISVSGDLTTTIRNLTLVGPLSATNGYGIKIAGDNARATLENVTVRDSGRSGIDFNGLAAVTITHVTAQNNGGVGLALTDSSNATVSGLTTTGNAWGGAAVYVYGKYYTLGSDGVVFTGTNTFGEMLALTLEATPTPAGATLANITNLTLPTELSHSVQALGYESLRMDYTINLTNALTAGVGGAPLAYVRELATGDFYVGAGMSIQTAVTVANAEAGDNVINVLEGTFVEIGQLVVTDDVTINGEGIDLTIVQPNSDTGSSGNARGWFLVNSGVRFDINNVTLDGATHDIYQGVRHFGYGTFDHVAFKNIQYPGYGGMAIAAVGSGMPINVTNSTFSQIGRLGVLYYGTGVSGSVFSGNVYTGKGAGDWLDYALDISAGAVITAANNTITGNRGVASSDGSTSAGVLVTTYFGGGTTALVKDNTFSDNYSGITVGYGTTDTSVVTATNNSITGNDVGIETASAQSVLVNGNTLTTNTDGLVITGTTTLTLTGNLIYANTNNGVTISDELSALGVTAVNNQFCDNGALGIENQFITTTLTATGNWWGAVDGPGPIATGNGDGVSAGVDYSNFITTPPTTGPCQVANLTIAKVTDPATGEPGFNFGGDLGAFSLDDGGNQLFQLTPGSYTITETAKSGWELTGAICTQDSLPVTDGISVTLARGDDVTCTFTNDPLPNITLSKTAAALTMPEPGGVMTFTVRITNTTAETVALTTLTDDIFGDLNGRGTCATGGDVPANGGTSCVFTETITGNAGDIHTDTITATVTDGEANTAAAADGVTIPFTDVQPAIQLTQTPAPAVLPEPGGVVTFTVQVDNLGVEPVLLVTLYDDTLYRGQGNLNGLGDCTVGGTIPAGDGYTCTFTKTVTGTAGDTFRNSVLASVVDDENNVVSASDTATVTLSNVNDAPTFTGTPVTTATEDTLFSDTITASDVDAGDTLTITAPTLPAWLTLTDNGDGTAALAGTPTNDDVGAHPVSLLVTDTGGLTDTQQFTITVANVNDAPVFTSTPPPTATIGSAYTYTITVDDVDTGDVLTITAPLLPTWLTFTDNGDGTATLTGTPATDDAGDNPVTLRVSDGTVTVTQQFGILVSEPSGAGQNIVIFLPLVMK